MSLHTVLTNHVLDAGTEQLTVKFEELKISLINSAQVNSTAYIR